MKAENGIFDVGGVLHSNEMPNVHSHIRQVLGLSPETYKLLWGTYSPDLGNGKITEEQFWQNFLSAAGISIELPEESLLLSEYKRRFNPNRSVLGTIKELKGKGVGLSILSNSIASHVAFLRGTGILDDFDSAVFSNEVGVSKPDPRIFLKSLEMVGPHTEKVFFVDDDRTNVQAATNLGITGIIYEDPDKLRADLAKIGAL